MAVKTSPFERVTEAKSLLERAIAEVQDFGKDRILQDVYHDVLNAYGRVCASQVEVRNRDRKAD
ncbi:hypothetical protein [Amycolatopsis sp. lyj-84]|uniref:hypothetical protein n=1 Tax=Amycolatopsis sp. lyj-84 TaxID=2789284 RepID=UPI00397C8D26